jgi:predicted TIM-barrel fold metal-dependent hydrolase
MFSRIQQALESLIGSKKSALEMEAIDAHLHVQSTVQAELVLQAMDRARIQKAIFMGSSRFTITLRPEDGFTGYHENNLELLKSRKAHPGRFEIWPTLDPQGPDNIKRFQDYVGEGASGLKLYVGHGFSYGTPPRYLFHTMPINSAPLMELYAFCDQNRLPICLHINTTSNFSNFREEFENVLESFPTLQILAPHWLLATRRPTYLRSVLERFPNLWTDISFGQDSILAEGLSNLTAYASQLRRLLLDYPDRVLFGTDLVCTNAPFKTVDWMATRMRTYREVLALDRLTCPVTQEPRKGLRLPKAVLKKIFRENAMRLLAYSSEKR